MSIQLQNDGENRDISEINVTPFVDVTLVLLIVFMVTAPLLTQVVQVTLPKTEKTEAASDNHIAILSVNAQGEPRLNDKAIQLALLEGELIALKERDPDINVQLQADRSAVFDSVAQVLSCARRSGISKLSFVTLEK